MPLFIKDDTVDDLAVRYQKITGAKTKTDAVRKALLAQLDAETQRKPLLERLEPILKRADGLGQGDPDFDMKQFTDEMWGH